MKKIIFFLLSMGSLLAVAQTADEVIKKYTAAAGGLEAFTKIKTAKITGTIDMQGLSLPITKQVINGKAVRMDVEAMGKTIITAYKNGKGWSQNPLQGDTKPTAATADELINYKTDCKLATPLMDYKAREHQVELSGQVDVEGIKTFKIKLTSKDDGKATNYYISTDDYMLIKSDEVIEMQGKQITTENWYADYKEYKGAKFFMNIQQKANGQVIQTITYKKIEPDVTIDEKIFDMPK